MELRNLRAFVEVVRQGGFTQAARTVFASQPTVSKAVKQLEADLGMPLLDRSGHRARPTAAGEVVYRRGLAMLALRDDLVLELDELRGLHRGSLRIGLPLLGSATLFAPVFIRFRARYPGIEISLLEHGVKRLEELLAAGELDLAATLMPVPAAFESQPVFGEPLMALLPAAHPQAGRDSLTLADLRESPFILFEAAFALNKVLLDACARRGFTPAVAARSSQTEFILALVEAGMGIAFLPRTLAEARRSERVSLVLLDEPETEWNLALIWRRGGYLSHAAQAWLELAAVSGPGD